jgi:polyisoprenoid-binding protein YceI
MRRGIRGTATALLLIAIGAAWRPVGEPLTIATGSKLWFDGKSTIRDWSCKATAIEGTIDAPGAAVVADVLKGQKAVKGATLTFPTSKLDCENGTMNGHMLRALNATQHPTITFALTGYELAADSAVKGTLQGTLTINGVAKPITLQALFAPAGPGLRVTGSYGLTMTEWQVAPPKLMMGALKVNPLVTVTFDLQLNP